MKELVIMMMKYFKKISSYIGVLTVFGSAVMFSVSTYMTFQNKKENTKNKIDEENNIIVDPTTLYTNLNTSDLYSSIRIKEGQGAIINNDMISKIITKIITESNFYNSEGLKYNYFKLNEKELLISFLWPQDGKKYIKNYKINLIQDI